MIKYALLSALAVLGLLSAACGSAESEPVETPQPAPAAVSSAEVSEVSTEVKIGNDIGNRLPDFELTLTSNGEKLTSAGLVESGRPAFLFFFATT